MLFGHLLASCICLTFYLPDPLLMMVPNWAHRNWRVAASGLPVCWQEYSVSQRS